MKAIVLNLLLVACSNLLMAQHGKISFNEDRYGYKNVAKERFISLYTKEKKSKAPIFSPTLLSDKYQIEELDFISIPILGWNQQAYKCGDNLEPLIDFRQDFLFQIVFVVAKENNLRVGAFEIFDSYNEENRKKDSINNIQFPLHGRPVMSDTDKVEKRLHEFVKENPNAFVFMIRGLHGYWAIIEGELVKLISKGCKIKGEPSSEFICKQYGEEFINDAITDNFRIGYKYLGCSDCKTNVPIRIDIKN